VLSVTLEENELARRGAGWNPPAPREKTGVLAKYARTVGSASEGAITG
jgi:dihydroxy-acid dehydratase